jgi:hypothetical protein
VISKLTLKRHIPLMSDDWNWWLAHSVRDDPDDLAEINPRAFAAVIASDQVKLFLCGRPRNSGNKGELVEIYVLRC